MKDAYRLPAERARDLQRELICLGCIAAAARLRAGDEVHQLIDVTSKIERLDHITRVLIALKQVRQP